MTIFEWIAVVILALGLFALWRIDATLTSTLLVLRQHLQKMEADLMTAKQEIEVISSVAGQYEKPVVRHV